MPGDHWHSDDYRLMTIITDKINSGIYSGWLDPADSAGQGGVTGSRRLLAALTITYYCTDYSVYTQCKGAYAHISPVTAD